MKNNRDVLDLLAASRPAALAPPPSDPERRFRHLENAFAQRVEPGRARRPHPRRRRTVGLGLGVVATAAATAVAIATIGQSGPPNRHHAAEQQVGGVNVALAAANQAALQPMAAYWSSDLVRAATWIVPAKTGDYAIAGAATEEFEWTSARINGGNLPYIRFLPARPLTASDVAAWRRAGSPKTFRVWSNDHYDTYTTKASDWSADAKEAMPGGTFPFAGFPSPGQPCLQNPGPRVPHGVVLPPCTKPGVYGATLDQLEKLPTDPASVTSRYRSAALMLGDRSTNTTDVARAVLEEVTWDLENAPVPPKLRAGMLRMLAVLPGVHRIDSVTDPLGRPGFAFAAQTRKNQNGIWRTEVIFGTDGTFLASRNVLVTPGGIYKTAKPGLVINYEAARSSGWTNTRPKPPTALPHYPF
jgi:hypothetical protein